MTNDRVTTGRICQFDASTWWGEVATDVGPIEFHATCYVGASQRSLPSVGESVDVLFSDATRSRLLSIIPLCRDGGEPRRRTPDTRDAVSPSPSPNPGPGPDAGKPCELGREE